uniref:Histone-lysine N-methyltransferase, H3 lysine-79 specific n=1 Tax=Globisporangium ultimum (strain ATCC 200006 / CBS 805.95 / DAOM BR144) TaxID=431595 RepID=K3WXD2_GLOUD
MSISKHRVLVADDSFVLEESEIDPVNPTQAISSLSEDTFALSIEAFNALYAQHPLRVAKEASRQERKENQYISMTLVYGEIAFGPFKTVFDILKRWHHVLVKPGGVFLDIGSGSGKAVFGATLIHDFDACYGIEILKSLHAISEDVLQIWERKVKRQFPLSLQKKRTRIAFTHGDALEVEWPTNADLVFLNSTCFGEVLLHDLTEKIHITCKPGTVIITATHRLPNTQNFDLLRTLKVQQETWGEATWFIHRKN